MKLLKNKEVFFHHNYWNKYKSDISPTIEEIINLEFLTFNFNIELVVLSIRKSIIKFNIISSSMYIIVSP